MLLFAFSVSDRAFLIQHLDVHSKFFRQRLPHAETHMKQFFKKSNKIQNTQMPYVETFSTIGDNVS